jgi:hypothetical protein
MAATTILCFQTMVIPEERDGKTDAAVQLDRDPSKPSNVASTRQAGGRESQVSENRKVILWFYFALGVCTQHIII